MKGELNFVFGRFDSLGWLAEPNVAGGRFPIPFHLYFQAMKVVSDKRVKEASEKLQKEKELSKIKVSKEDIDLIVSINLQLRIDEEKSQRSVFVG